MVKGLVIPALDTDPLAVREFTQIEDYQKAVGGWIEAVDIPALGITIYVNEEGLIHHLPFNSRATFLWWYHVPAARNVAMLVGKAVVVGPPDQNGDNTDIPDGILGVLTARESWGVLLNIAEAEPVDPGADWTSRVVAPLVKGDPRWFASQVEYTDYFAACAWAMILENHWASAQETKIVPFAEILASRK